MVDAQEKAKESESKKEITLTHKVKTVFADYVKVAATSAVLAYIGLTKECSSVPKSIGLASPETSGLQSALCAIDVGAGAFAGYTKRYFASLTAFAASLYPEISDILQSSGNAEEIGKRVLAKTIVYGASYALGHIFSPKE
jgi:hypothetical protein